MGVVNIIDKKNNLERIQTRFKSDLKKFKETPNENPAPQSPSTLYSEDVIEEQQNKLKQNIIQLIEYCTCKTKTIWQADIIGKEAIFGERAVTTYQKYGDCDGVGIDLLMLFDQQKVDLRESTEEKKKENVYPSAIIPLSTRSQYLLPLTRTGKGAIVFSANEKKKARALLGDICAKVHQPLSLGAKEQEYMLTNASKKPDQLQAAAVRLEYRKKLRTKIRKTGRGGKKTRRRRKNRTKRKTRKRRKRKKQKTRRKRH